MTGWVDAAGRSLVAIRVKPSDHSLPTQLESWIDTGFTGELVLSQSTIAALSLPQSGTAQAQLADGSIILMNTYSCLLEWFGSLKQVVVGNDGDFPLLGVGLLRGHKLTVDYPLETVAVE
jgi:clan AA aspartic protease